MCILYVYKFCWTDLPQEAVPAPEERLADAAAVGQGVPGAAEGQAHAEDEGGRHDPEARARVGEAGAVLPDAGQDGAAAGQGQGLPGQEAPPRVGQ